MVGKYYIFKELTRITGVGTIYTDWIDVSSVYELLVFIKLTAQGEHTNETLSVSAQTRTPNKDAVDLKNVAFDEIKNKIGELPFTDYVPFAAFGNFIRWKITTNGNSPDYTLKITGHGKG